jgi:hypothetical protein
MSLLFTEPLPILSEGIALLPEQATMDETTYRFADSKMAFVITYLPYDALQQKMIQLGAPKDLLESPEIHAKLSQTVAFSVLIQNTGQDVITFNPDQITFNERKSGPCGFMLDVADFWPPTLVYAQADRVAFAQAFQRGTHTVAPGQSHQQLVVFERLFDRKFPKRVELRLERIYFGIETLQLACGFRVRYPK